VHRREEVAVRASYDFSRAHGRRISRSEILVAKRHRLRIARIGKEKVTANFLSAIDKVRANRPRGLRAVALRLSLWWHDQDWRSFRVKWWLQRRIRGWADCDVWNAGNRITDLALLLLEKYIAIPPQGYPASYRDFDAWMRDVRECRWTLRAVKADDPRIWKRHQKRLEAGLRLCGEILFTLWD
jgi:hypothetical protein